MTAALRACLILTTALGLACGEDVTEVVVIADSDLDVPDGIDTVRFQVDATEVGDQTTTRRVALNEGGTVLPVRITVVHDEGPLGPIDVTATGMREGEDVVSRNARFHFVRGESLVLQMDLLARCLDESCPEGMTCAEGGCRDVDVDPGELRRDAGMPESDAGPPDAGPMCVGACMCDATCTTDLPSCECTEGCECSYRCPSGGECEQVKCDGPGTVCTVESRNALGFRDFKCDHEADCTIDANGASEVDVKCDHGARCDVDCTGATYCKVDCRGDAQCTVVCDPTETTCEIKECSEDDLDVCGDLIGCRIEVCDG